MKLKNAIVKDILFRRPGINKIEFIADYGDYKRRGVIHYDTTKKCFITHANDLELIASLMLYLRSGKSVVL